MFREPMKWVKKCKIVLFFKKTNVSLKIIDGLLSSHLRQNSRWLQFLTGPRLVNEIFWSSKTGNNPAALQETSTFMWLWNLSGYSGGLSCVWMNIKQSHWKSSAAYVPFRAICLWAQYLDPWKLYILLDMVCQNVGHWGQVSSSTQNSVNYARAFSKVAARDSNWYHALPA